MNHLLDNLVIRELSLVDSPANVGARVTILKSADPLPSRDIVAKSIRSNRARNEQEASDRIDDDDKRLPKVDASSDDEEDNEDDEMPDDTFDAAVNRIAQRDKLPRHRAMSKAREQHPDLFNKYQSEQRDLIAKAAPRPIQKSEAVFKFERLVDRVRARDRCSRTEALSKARTEFPESYAAYNNAAA